MTRLTEEKAARIGALLAGLPGDMADRLCASAERGDAELGRLLDYCRRGAQDSARRRFFEPLETVSGDPQTTRPSRAYAPAALQRAIWDWLEQIAPRVGQAAHQAAADFSDDTPGRLDPARAEAAAAISQALNSAQADPRAARKLRARLGVDDFEPVRHLAGLLAAAPVTRQALDQLPRTIHDFSDELSVSVRDRYEAACEADPDAAVWVLFLIMARMERPWRLLRVFERIIRRGDDLLVSRTDMAEIGDALLDDAAYYLSHLARPVQTAPDAEAAARALSGFAAVTVGMTREIGIRKDGDWGRRLVDLRNRASEAMIALHAAARDAFRKATPEEGGLRQRVDQRPSPGEPAYEQAVALGHFLMATRDDAQRAAVGGAHQAIIEEITERLDALTTKLLRSLGSASGAEREAIALRLEHLSALLKAVGALEAARTCLRRVAAARAA